MFSHSRTQQNNWCRNLSESEKQWVSDVKTPKSTEREVYTFGAHKKYIHFKWALVAHFRNILNMSLLHWICIEEDCFKTLNSKQLMYRSPWDQALTWKRLKKWLEARKENWLWTSGGFVEWHQGKWLHTISFLLKSDIYIWPSQKSIYGKR